LERSYIDNDEEQQSLLAQHHAYLEGINNEQNDPLLQEIKKVYCDNLQMRRYTTILLAESSELMAAEAVGLPRCHRLKPNGQNLIKL
jgi:hypothetical protein